MFWAIQQALNRDDKLREEGRQEGRLEGHQEGLMEGREQRDDELIREARETGFVQIGDMKIPVPGEGPDKENGNPADAAP